MRQLPLRMPNIRSVYPIWYFFHYVKKKLLRFFFFTFIAIRPNGAIHQLTVCFSRAPGGPDKYVHRPNIGRIKMIWKQSKRLGQNTVFKDKYHNTSRPPNEIPWIHIDILSANNKLTVSFYLHCRHHIGRRTIRHCDRTSVDKSSEDRLTNSLKTFSLHSSLYFSSGAF